MSMTQQQYERQVARLSAVGANTPANQERLIAESNGYDPLPGRQSPRFVVLMKREGWRVSNYGIAHAARCPWHS